MVFGVIGGDRRQAELAALLAADGKEVCTYGLGHWKAVGGTSLDRAADSEVILLPLPLCRGDGVLNCEEAPMPTADLFRRLQPEQIVLAGQVKPAQQQEAEQCGLRLRDYFLREELTVANAAATAEAALQVAMERLDRTLLGLNCLVLGFGRIGRLLSYRLHGLGAHVTAAARKPEDLAWIRAYGWAALEIGKLDRKISGFDAVFAAQPLRGSGFCAGDRSDGSGTPGDARCLGAVPAGENGSPYSGGSDPGCRIPHVIYRRMR